MILWITNSAIFSLLVAGMFYYYLRKVWKTDPHYQSVYSIEDLRPTYQKWEYLDLVLLFVIAPLIGSMVYFSLAYLSDARLSILGNNIYVLSVDKSVNEVPALVAGIVLSSYPLHYIFLYLLGRNGLREFNAFSNLKRGYDGYSRFLLVGPAAVLLIVVFSLCAINSYVRVAESSIYINRYFSLDEKRYSLENIEQIDLVHSFRAPVGNIVNRPHYVIYFDDGAEYGLRRELSEPKLSRQKRLVHLLMQMSGLQLSEREI